MSIKLITGNTFKCVSERVFDEIKHNGMTSGRHIVIIPDQFTLLSEMEVLDHLGIKSSFNIEVAGFSRLATKVLGDRGLKMLNQVTSVMLLKKVIMESQDELLCYNRVCKKAGYVSELYAVITNMRNSKITPVALRKTASISRGVIANKLIDIALIYERYISLLSTRYADMGSELESLAREIPNLDYIKNAHIYVVDFHELTRVKMDILSAFIEHSQSFTIGVVDVESAKNSRLYPHFLVKFVMSEVSRLDLAIDREQVAEDLSEERREISDRLFSYNLQTDVKSAGHFEIKIAGNITHEVRSIARYIRQLAVEENYRYRDIAIVASDVDKYKTIIAKEFADFDIPVYLDDKKNLSTTAIAKLLNLSIDAVDKNMRKDEMIRLSKSEIIGLNHSDVNAFELYANKFSINYSRFASKFTIATDDPLYEGAEKVRSFLCEILSVLSEKSDSTLGYINCIKDFYNLATKDSYSQYINALNLVDKRSGKVAEIAIEKVMNCITQIEDLFESVEMDLSEVVDIIFTAFSSIEIATIPQFVDSVFLGQVDKSKYQHNKVMFILGASDGNYPKDGVSGGIITASEAKIIESKGVEFFPNNRDKILLDKFYICQLLLKATDKVVISYDMQSGEPSVLVRQVERIAGVTPMLLAPEGNIAGVDNVSYGRKISTKANAISEIMTYYSERMSGTFCGDEKVFDYLYTKMNSDFDYQYLMADKSSTHIMPNKDAWSIKEGKTFARVSAIERYFECPFKFFLDNVLKLKEPITGDLKPSITGTFIHEIAEKYFASVSDMFIDEHKRDAIVMDICKNTIKSDAFADIVRGMTEIGIEKQLFARARFTIAKLVKCHGQSDFAVSGTEVRFGMNENGIPPLEIDVYGKKYYMRGIIDRVDKLGDSIAIIDYKTKSSMSFGLKDVYYGGRVQLLLYLNALQADGSLEPFALYYMPMPYGYKNPSKNSTNYKYVGLTRNSDVDIEHFDREFRNNESCVPVGITSKGEIKNTGLYTMQEFDKLKKYSLDVISDAISEIDSGYIEPKPIDKACEYCDYGSICKSRGNAECKRYYKSVSMEAKDE